MSLQKGFTLIELLIIVIIIALLAAIAIPSYQRYIIRNAESLTKTNMEQLSMDLESWKANALTYKGFTPKKVAADGAVTYGYADNDNTFIYFPINSNNSNYRYKLTITDSAGNTLKPSSSSVTTTASNAWRMLAEPSESLAKKGASKMLLTSDNAKCKSTGEDKSFTVTSSCTGKESW